MRNIEKGTYGDKYETKFMDWIHYIFGENLPDAHTIEMMYVAYKYGFEQGLCEAMKEKRDAKNGTYNGYTTFCPVNASGDCPYCDKCNVCHIEDPLEDCDDWGAFWESWEDWLAADDVGPDAPTDFAEDEIRWAGDVYGYEDTMEDNSDDE